jgi:3-methyladenine DNA glycosylase AlkD
MSKTIVAELMAELAALENPKMRAVNEKHGDDHGVNLSKLRAIAKRLKPSRTSPAYSGRRMTLRRGFSRC